MNCMKCGREIEEKRVFCSLCTEEMERYPVKPGTVVQIPTPARPQQVKKQNARAKEITPEMQIASLRRAKKRLTAVLLCVILVAGAAIGALLILLQRSEKEPLGKNYSTVPIVTAPDAEAADTQPD